MTAKMRKRETGEWDCEVKVRHVTVVGVTGGEDSLDAWWVKRESRERGGGGGGGGER